MKIISDEDLLISTLGGTAVRFAAGVARDISEEIGFLAIQQGAREVTENSAPKPAVKAIKINNPIEPEEVQEIQEASAFDPILLRALENMITEGEIKNFRKDGYPKANAVNDAAGRIVTSDERQAAWEAIINA